MHRKWRFTQIGVPLLVAVIALASGTIAAVLQSRARTAARSALTIGSIRFAMADLQNAPFNASPRAGGSPAAARAEIAADEHVILGRSRQLVAAGAHSRTLEQVPALVRDVGPEIAAILRLGTSGPGYTSQATNQLRAGFAGALSRMMKRLNVVAVADDRRAGAASVAAIVGGSATILVLVLLFAALYRRTAAARSTAERLSEENIRLLAASRDEAMSDALTGLGNRRAFKLAVQSMPTNSDQLVAIFDLNGFKQYNDTFGHAAGDALLVRLAVSLQEAVGERGQVYRLGGDEFCLVADGTPSRGEDLVRTAASALSDGGEGWEIDCAWGAARTPSEADSADEALDLADKRMYAQKNARATPAGQVSATLLQLLVERDTELGANTRNVTELVDATARRLRVEDGHLGSMLAAAQLHDIGKIAIPEAILTKPCALDETEWAFIRQHTVIGERILAAAPSLAGAATLVRSTHERVDGGGYPDGLAGDEIPLGARIIAVCDAYDAMTSNRCYRVTLGRDAALTELRRCSGSQFDEQVVTAFCDALGHPDSIEPGATASRNDLVAEAPSR